MTEGTKEVKGDFRPPGLAGPKVKFYLCFEIILANQKRLKNYAILYLRMIANTLFILSTYLSKSAPVPSGHTGKSQH